ncbi:MAG: hypothetical protein WD696_03600 [Bryobacteraceae bacterium]
MKRISAAAISLLIISFVPAPLYAKGYTVKITIKGTGLTTPLEIISLKVREFGVWEGPGVYVNDVEQSEGFIIDWPKGIVAQIPSALQHYEVSFYSGCKTSEFGCRTSEPSLVYVVSYDYDPSTQQGFVYLPGRDDEAFRFNHAIGFTRRPRGRAS